MSAMKKTFLISLFALGQLFATSANAQSSGNKLDLPANNAQASLNTAPNFTTLTGWNLSYSGYTYPNDFPDSIAIGSMFSPNHRGFDNSSGTFTGTVNGACPSFGLADPRCDPSAATPPEAAAYGSIAIGQSARVLTTGISDPTRDVLAGEFGIAIGSASEVSGYHGVAVGLLSQASGVAASAFGPEARAQGTQAIAVGDISTASGDRAVSIGALSAASGDFTAAYGYFAEATADQAVAIGGASAASGIQATALGTLTTASGVGATALGSEGNASGDGGVAVGYRSLSSGIRAIAIGSEANAQADAAIAIGDLAAASGDGGIALGAGAVATGLFSTAIGAGAISDRDGLMVIGGPTASEIRLGDVNTKLTLPGLASGGSFVGRKNQAGRTELVTVDENGVAGTQSSAELIDEVVSKMNSGNLSYAINSTGALVAAMSAVPTMSPQVDEPVRCGFGTGGIGSSYAFSAGCALRVNDRFHLNGAISYTDSINYFNTTSSNVAGRLGFSFPLFVRKDNQRLSSNRAALREMESLKAENKTIQEENLSIKQELARLKNILNEIVAKSGLSVAKNQ